MKKKLSVIISVICIIASLGSILGTLYYAKNHNTSSTQQTGGRPPSMPSQIDNSSQNSNQPGQMNQDMTSSSQSLSALQIVIYNQKIKKKSIKYENRIKYNALLVKEGKAKAYNEDEFLDLLEKEGL